MTLPPNPDFNDREFSLWLAEAVKHMDHLLVSIHGILLSLRIILLALILLLVVMWLTR